MTYYFKPATALLAIALCAVATGGTVAADSLHLAAKDAPKSAPDALPAPVPSEPRETSASFGDWVTRCDRIGPETAAKTVCEAAQTLIVKGQQAPIAQIAFGRGEGNVLGLTVLLPLNISFDKAPSLGIEGDDVKAVNLTLRRCIPAGCFADAKIEASLLSDFRSAQKPGRLSFTDASGHGLVLPLSFRGLSQALDNLNKHS
jgi:invasion protein IalB